MSATILSNDCFTTLAATITDSQTAITVVDGSAFPPSGNFHIRIDDEIMRVNSVSGNTWGVDRAWEKVDGVQLAATHNAGTEVDGVYSVDALTSGATPGSYINPVATIDQYGRISTITNGTNRFFSGTGIPNPASGLVGDYYIDIATSIVYQKS